MIWPFNKKPVILCEVHVGIDGKAYWHGQDGNNQVVVGGAESYSDVHGAVRGFHNVARSRMVLDEQSVRRAYTDFYARQHKKA